MKNSNLSTSVAAEKNTYATPMIELGTASSNEVLCSSTVEGSLNDMQYVNQGFLW